MEYSFSVKRVEGLTLNLKSMEIMMQSAQLFIKKHSTCYVLNGQLVAAACEFFIPLNC